MEVPSVDKVPIGVLLIMAEHTVFDLEPDRRIYRVPSPLCAPEIDAGRFVCGDPGVTLIVITLGRVAALVAPHKAFYVAPPPIVSGSEGCYCALH